MPVSLGPAELLMILCIIVLIFGAGKLSSVGSALGMSIRDFRKAAHDDAEAEHSPS